MSNFPNSLDALKPNTQFSHTLVINGISFFLVLEEDNHQKYIDFNFQRSAQGYGVHGSYIFRAPLNSGKANLLKDFFEALSQPNLTQANVELKTKQEYFKSLGNDPADWASACFQMARSQNISIDENYLAIWLEHALNSVISLEPDLLKVPDSDTERELSESRTYLDALDDTFIVKLSTPVGNKDYERPLQVGDHVVVGQVKYPAIIKKIGACTADIRRTDNGDYWTVHLSDISLDKNRPEQAVF